MQQENPLNYMFLEEEPVNYREVFDKYFHYWKWFLLGIVLALLGAYLYLRYTPNQYAVTSTILIEDENSGGLPSELSAFDDLGLTGGIKKQIETEIGILKSHSLMERVVKDLGINVTYFKKGRVGETEIYKNEVPFKVTFLSKDSLFYKIDTSFSITAISETNFKLKNSEGITVNEGLFGNKIATGFGDITIIPNALNSVAKNEEIFVNVSPLTNVVESLKGTIQVELLYKKSTLIELSLKTTIKQKGQDILNDLVQQYNKDAVEDKSQIGKNTDRFINERLAVIEKDLSNVDKGAEEFKTLNKLTDITSEAALILENSSTLEKKIVELNTQLKIAAYVTTYINENANKLIPANLGLNDGAVNSNSDRFNELLLERNRFLKSSKEKNPVIINLDSQLAELRGSISQGLVNLKSSLTIALNDAMREENSAHVRISAVPKQEREYRDIQRQQQIIETLYLYLLEKREENAITLAVTIPNAKVIDTARSSVIPISPKGKIIYLAALMIGVLLPFMVFYILFLFDNKVHTSKDIEATLKAPYLGEIPKTKDAYGIVVKEADRSGIAESFRMVRTNIDFMLAGVKSGGKTIFITSTLPSEGKTFVSVNMASALALSNKKVLLIGADIRKPKLKEYLHIDNDKGLTHYLTGAISDVKSLIIHQDKYNFDVLHSGIAAPNPSELLSNGRFEELLAFGKANYDYVLVDTAPVKLVTDTFLLGTTADLFIYVIRANFLDKRLLEIPTKLYNEKKLPNMSVLLNDIDIERGYGYGYGYSYGYGYGEVEKPWWKRIFKK